MIGRLRLFYDEAQAPDPVIAAAPVGVEIDTEQGIWGLATATFDTTRQYRYRLSRVWDTGAPRANFVMLNPSTADAFVVDPTVRRCIGFARAWGCGSVEITNAFAYRATDPKVMAAQTDPIGPGNDDAILAAARAANLVIAAWGVHATLGGRDLAVRRLLADARVELRYLRLTKAGHPGHPLYIPAGTAPVDWNP